MSYIAFDLDALNVVPDVAAASSMSPGDVAHGLLKLWAWCFRGSTDRVSDVHLAGFFGGAKAGPALAAFGFLDPHAEGWRVRGADRYLRVQEARRKGGLAAKKHLRPGGKPSPVPAEAAAEPQPRLQPSFSREAADADPRLDLGSTPSTEHRAPNTESEALGAPDGAPPPTPPSPVVRLAPVPPSGDSRWSSGGAYFAFLQSERHAAGLAGERCPRGFNAWFSEAMMQLNGDGPRLDATVAAFARDPYWRDKGLPVAALMSEWAKYVPRRAAGVRP